MPRDDDRIEQIRARRNRNEDIAQGGYGGQQQPERQRPGQQTAAVGKIAGVPGGAQGIAAGSPSPWLRDRVTLSLEAQIAMIEMRATYKLTLADMGYHNRLQIAQIRPGIYLKVEPTGCYKMSYHNRL